MALRARKVARMAQGGGAGNASVVGSSSSSSSSAQDVDEVSRLRLSLTHSTFGAVLQL